MNNGSYHTEQFRRKQSEKVDRLFGSVLLHDKTCEQCSGDFEWVGRHNTVAFVKARFCCRACANSVGGNAKADKYPSTHYRAICFRNHERKCVVCGEDKIVAVHHLDHDKSNDNPENLIPMCPTHHGYWHSKYRYLVESDVLEYVKSRGYGVNGNTSALHAGTESSILSTST